MWWDFVGHFSLVHDGPWSASFVVFQFSLCFLVLLFCVWAGTVFPDLFSGCQWLWILFSYFSSSWCFVCVSVSVVFYFGSVLENCLALFRTRWNFSLSFYLPNRKLSSTFIFSLFILLRHMNLIYTYTLDLSCPEWSTPLHLGWDEIARGPPDPIIGLSIRILTNCSRIHPGFHCLKSIDHLGTRNSQLGFNIDLGEIASISIIILRERDF